MVWIRAHQSPTTATASTSGQLRSASVAQAFVLSLWHDVHGFGILSASVIAGGDELERVAAHVHVGDRLRDRRHVAATHSLPPIRRW